MDKETLMNYVFFRVCYIKNNSISYFKFQKKKIKPKNVKCLSRF